MRGEEDEDCMVRDEQGLSGGEVMIEGDGGGMGGVVGEKGIG